MYTIYSPCVTVQIEEMGAELCSIQDTDHVEYLWQGDKRYWEGKAPNLFPYIARMTNGQYKLDGKTYQMDIHGFAKDTVFAAKQRSDSEIVFAISQSEETYRQYPFRFDFLVGYKLEGRTLTITFKVQNQDTKTMYFGLGGHPGFRVPLEPDTVFEDYYLEFSDEREAKRVDFSEDCFVLGTLSAFELEEGRILALKHDLFDEDAIILTDVAPSVTLTSPKSQKGIRVTYPDMRYLGVWHMPKTDAPYVCIEPWTSLPSRKGIVEDLAAQPGLIALEPGAEYVNQWSIEIL